VQAYRYFTMAFTILRDGRPITCYYSRLPEYEMLVSDSRPIISK